MPQPPTPIPLPPSEASGVQWLQWANAVTDFCNGLPPLSLFSGDPNSQVTADKGTLGFNLADSSATSAVWAKNTSASNTGWRPLA